MGKALANWLTEYLENLSIEVELRLILVAEIFKTQDSFKSILH